MLSQKSFMASLPSVALPRTIKHDPEFRKHPTSSPTTEKNQGISYPKNKTLTQVDGSSELKSLDFREALSLIKEGPEKVQSSHYVPLLQKCLERNSVMEAQIVHGHIVKTGTQADLFIMTILINVYAKCGTMDSARKVFENMPQRNVVSWTTLMTGYVNNSQPAIAIQVFQEMLEAGAYPTNYTFGSALNACSLLHSVRLGKQFHAYIIKYGSDFDNSLGNAICSLYSKLGYLESAIKSFERIREKDVISWTAVVSACGDNGKAAKGLRFFSQMLAENIKPNEMTLTSVSSLCCTTLSLGLGAQVHSLSIKLGYESYLPLKNSIMYLYLKCGCMNEAQKLFDEMETIRLVTWNAMIAGHAQMMELVDDDIAAHKSGYEALNNFVKLNRSGMNPDPFTISSVLTVCSRLVALEQGEQIHAQTIKSGFLSDVVLSTALINMYSKCGSIEEACKAFVEMDTRTMISWTSMIACFSQQGRSKQALQLFDDMRLAGVRPNQITFVGVLSACSQAGMVDEALSYFEMMQKKYKIKPVMDHFACLIDMFVRLGQLNEAFDFIKNMDLEPNEFIWSLLIGGCRSHGNLELAFEAAEELLKLKPKRTENYVLLLNMYLSAGRWQDVSRVRKMMREEKVGQLKDFSWISVKNRVYSFKPNDKSHFHTSDIYKSLEDLLGRANALGYEPLDALDANDEEVKTPSSTAYHSEKLAIAFGLLNVPNAAPVRVIKSIFMCRDCHNFAKFVSLLTAREIIIRDSKRLHKFVHGRCSCGDFGGLI